MVDKSADHRNDVMVRSLFFSCARAIFRETLTEMGLKDSQCCFKKNRQQYLLNEAECDVKNYADQGGFSSEKCIILNRRLNSAIVSLFIQNVSVFSTALPPRRPSSKHYLCLGTI